MTCRDYVIDTAVLVRHLCGRDHELPSCMRTILNEHLPQGKARLVIPAIVIWELHYLVDARGRFRYVMFRSTAEFVEYVRAHGEVFEIAPLTRRIREIADRQVDPGEVPEYADRVIIATAISRRAVLMTWDEKIVRYCLAKKIPVVWY